MCSPACLSNYRLFRRDKTFYYELPKYLNKNECKLIMEILKRYMDDGFNFWPLKLNFENFKRCLNNIHLPSKFTFENPEIVYENEKKVQFLKFLAVKIILQKGNSVETDIYYKPTYTNDYLPCDSTHPDHTKNNIPYNIAKTIIVFVSNPEKVIIRLDELRQLLKKCKYPECVISKSIFNAKL